MQLFYCPNIIDNHAQLDEQEARHCLKVLRKKVGDMVHVIDGKGKLFEGEMLELSKKSATLAIQKCLDDVEESKAGRLHLAVAPTKNISRVEWLLEKATEIGIHEITTLRCKRSERKQVRLDRLEKILVAAMKQSMNLWLPQLHELTDFEAFLQEQALVADQINLIAYCNDENLPLLKTIYPPQSNVCILIGPEGDFTEEEVKFAKAQGFKGISLGKSRLRTETAALMVVATINLLNEDD